MPRPVNETRWQQQILTNSFKHDVRQLINKKFGYRVVHVNVKTPLVSGYIGIATKILNDSGCPHTLEHLCFLGSRKYPYKGILDKWANRAFARGTNAWTDVDETIYTIETIGSEGFLNILPVYVNHVMDPLLTESGCLTEVYNVDGQGKEAGVVFSEMLTHKTDAHSIVTAKMHKSLFSIKSGLASETGGLPEALRTLSVDTIRKYHSEYYKPENMCIGIIGNIDPAQLDEYLAKIDSFLEDMPGIHGSSGPQGSMRPWVDYSLIKRPEKSISCQVNFPDNDEGMGLLSITWIGPKSTDYKSTEAIDILSIYLSDSAVSPLQAKFVEISNPYCSSLAFAASRRAFYIVSIEFESTPVDMMESLQKAFFQELLSIAQTELDMNRISSIIERIKLSTFQEIENSPQSFYIDSILFDFKYGPQTVESYANGYNSIQHLEELQKWNSRDWQNLLKTWFIDNHSCSVMGKPSAELAKSSKLESEKRVKEIVEFYGTDGLKELQEKLESARIENDKPIPEDLLKSFKISDVNEVQFLSTRTVRTGLAKANQFCDENLQKEFDNSADKLDLYLQFDEFESEFVDIRAYIGVNKIDVDLKVLVDIYFDYIFACPMKINEELKAYEEVVTRLDADLQQYDHYSSCAEASEVAMIYLQCSRKKYELGIYWLKHLLFSPAFDAKRFEIFAKKAMQDIPSQKRNGPHLLNSVFLDTVYSEKSTYRASNLLSQEKALQSIIEDMYSNPEKVQEQFSRLKKQLMRPENIRFSVFGGIKFIDRPMASFAQHFEGIANNVSVNAYESAYNCLSERGKNPSGNALIIPSPCIESCESIHFTKGIGDQNHPDLPALILAIEYLEALEGLIWKEIRGAGLAYGAYFRNELESGLLQFVLYRTPDAYNGWKAAANSIKQLLLHPERISDIELDSARSVLVYKFGKMVSTGSKAAKQSFGFLSILDRPKTYNQELLDKVMKVSKAKIVDAISKYILKIFDSKISETIIVCANSLISDLSNGFEISGFKVSKMNVIAERLERRDSEGSETNLNFSFLRKAIQQAEKCDAFVKRFRVGCVIVDENKTIISTGYTGQTGQNSHAEEVALSLSNGKDLSKAVLYSTLEPCCQRLSTKNSCAELIIKSGIKHVVFAAQEPNLFVSNPQGKSILESQGVCVEEFSELAKQALDVGLKSLRDTGYV